MKRARHHASRLARTPSALVLLGIGAACFTALLIFAPDDVRGWLIGPGAGGALATIAALYIRLRGDAPEEPRETQPPEAP